MFRGNSEANEPLLPLGGGNSGYSKKPKFDMQIPQVGAAQIASFIWLGFSLVMLVAGVIHSRYYAVGTLLECDAKGCQYKYYSGPKALIDTWIDRKNIQRAELVRISQGQIVSTATMSRKQQRKLTQSYALTYYEFGDAEEEDTPQTTKQALLGVKGSSRKKAKNRVAKLNRYTRNEIDEVKIDEHQFITVGGGISIALGFISLVFSLLLGEFSPPKSKQKKAS